PPWLWLVLIAGFLLIAYNYSFFRSETEVSYAWFLDQVDADNVKAIRIQQGTEVTGELRAETRYQPLKAQQSIPIRRFTTYFPSESSIQPVVVELREKKRRDRDGNEVPRGNVTIETTAPPGAGGLLWLTLLLPTFLIVGLIYVMMRRARDQFDGGIL